MAFDKVCEIPTDKALWFLSVYLLSTADGTHYTKENPFAAGDATTTNGMGEMGGAGAESFDFCTALLWLRHFPRPKLISSKQCD